jgi:hypothetical protein
VEDLGVDAEVLGDERDGRRGAFAADVDAERGVLETRLQELAQRIDEALANARVRLG